MAGHVGLEPTTYRLTAECSTIELMSHVILHHFHNLAVDLTCIIFNLEK